MVRGVLPPGPRLPPPLQLARFLRRPFGFLDGCAERFGHVFTVNFMIGGPAVMIAEPDHLRAVWSRDRNHELNKGRRFLLEPVLGPRSVLLQVGDEHLRRRKLMLPPFHGERMRSYAQVMEEVTLRDMERWPRGEPFALLPRMQRITLDVILRAVFGTTAGEREDELRARLTTLLEQTNRPSNQIAVTLDWVLGGRVAPFAAAVRPVDELIAREIADRHAAGDLEEREDVLSLLMLARDEDGEALSDAELRDQLMTLLVAGHETTATGLAWTFDALFRNPGVLRRLKASLAAGEEDYLAAVVDESLRIRPVVPEVGRQLGVPVEVDGHELPAGTSVFASVQLAHRRADLYPDPLAFRPERFLEDKGPTTYSWIPFGGGTRRCLGAAFAQFEMRRVLATIVTQADLEPGSEGAEPVQRRPVTLAPRSGTPACSRRDVAGPATATQYDRDPFCGSGGKAMAGTVGVLLALGAAVAYALGVTLQAIEARATPGDESLRLSLLSDLVRKRRWILGTVCVVLGWALQAAALTLVPITIVQPALALSIVVLLVIGLRMHDESLGVSDVIGTIAIIVGVIGLAAVAPAQSEAHAEHLTLAIGMAVLGLVALAPYALHASGRGVGAIVAVGAGVSYAWTGLSTKFLTDASASGAWLVAGLWLAATAGAALVGLLSEMTALQTRSAIRVFPVVLVVQIVMAVLLAPLLAGERWEPTPVNVGILLASLAVIGAGTRLLAGARAVSRVVATT